MMWLCEPARAAVLLLSVAALAAAYQSQSEVEKRVDALAGGMTLDEKIGQMSQSTSMATPISDRIKQEIRQGRWGSFLNAGSPADRAEAQRIARHETRLGIPLVFGRDVIHGYRTIFPIPLGQAASHGEAVGPQQAFPRGARGRAGEGGPEGMVGFRVAPDGLQGHAATDFSGMRAHVVVD